MRPMHSIFCCKADGGSRQLCLPLGETPCDARWRWILCCKFFCRLNLLPFQGKRFALIHAVQDQLQIVKVVHMVHTSSTNQRRMTSIHVMHSPVSHHSTVTITCTTLSLWTAKWFIQPGVCELLEYLLWTVQGKKSLINLSVWMTMYM